MTCISQNNLILKLKKQNNGNINKNPTSCRKQS